MSWLVVIGLLAIVFYLGYRFHKVTNRCSSPGCVEQDGRINYCEYHFNRLMRKINSPYHY